LRQIVILREFLLGNDLEMTVRDKGKRRQAGLRRLFRFPRSGEFVMMEWIGNGYDS
jgi:hypothetical protein